MRVTVKREDKYFSLSAKDKPRGWLCHSRALCLQYFTAACSQQMLQNCRGVDPWTPTAEQAGF